jgi:D-alanyl-D-alanine dipeptidase
MQSNIITTGLSLEEIKKVQILENNEPLTPVIGNEKLVLLTEHKFLDARLRRSVVEVLYKVAESLPEGYALVLVTAYRPIWMQRKLWRQRLFQMAKRYPLKMIFKYPVWKKEVSRYTAPPGGSSHQVGAAVDVTIIDPKGERLDMGTSLTAFGELCNTHNNNITSEQKANRKLLYDTMISAGFINYPLEWWHYSYGDRMWAAYSNQNRCVYGPLSE